MEEKFAKRLQDENGGESGTSSVGYNPVRQDFVMLYTFKRIKN